jgi:hypothetical protein
MNQASDLRIDFAHCLECDGGTVPFEVVLPCYFSVQTVGQEHLHVVEIWFVIGVLRPDSRDEMFGGQPKVAYLKAHRSCRIM